MYISTCCRRKSLDLTQQMPIESSMYAHLCARIHTEIPFSLWIASGSTASYPSPSISSIAGIAFGPLATRTMHFGISKEFYFPQVALEVNCTVPWQSTCLTKKYPYMWILRDLVLLHVDSFYIRIHMYKIAQANVCVLHQDFRSTMMQDCSTATSCWSFGGLCCYLVLQTTGCTRYLAEEYHEEKQAAIRSTSWTTCTLWLSQTSEPPKTIRCFPTARCDWGN